MRFRPLVHALVALAAGTGPAHAESYRTVDLGILDSDADAVFAHDLNDAGQVVGDAHTRIGERGFRWSRDQGVRDLGSIDGGPVRTTAQAIDERGQVTGSSALGERFRPDHAVLWPRPGEAVELGDLGAGIHYSRGRALGPAGVVGSASDGETERPFIWREARGIAALTDADGQPLRGRAMDINAGGVIVGYALTDNGPAPLRGTAGDGLATLPRDGASTGRALTVNADGVTAGVLHADGGFEAVLWAADGGLRRLGARSAEPRDIDARGRVVGRVLGARGARAFLWTEADGLRELGDLLDAGDESQALRLYSAEAINRHGEIIAYGRRGGGPVRSYLLVPDAE